MSAKVNKAQKERNKLWEWNVLYWTHICYSDPRLSLRKTSASKPDQTNPHWTDKAEQLFRWLSCRLKPSLQACGLTLVLEGSEGLKLTDTVSSGLQKAQGQILRALSCSLLVPCSGKEVSSGLSLHFLKGVCKIQAKWMISISGMAVSFQSLQSWSFETPLIRILTQYLYMSMYNYSIYYISFCYGYLFSM